MRTDGGVQTASITEYEPLPTGERQYPLEFIESRGALRLGDADGQIVVGLAPAADAGLERMIRAFHDRPVRFVRVDRMELTAWLARATSRDLPAEDAHARPAADPELSRLADDAPVVNYVNGLILDALRRRASDIHIERFTKEAIVRYRVDGRLRAMERLPPDRFPRICSRIKVMANLNIMERRLPQDGRITLQIDGRGLDVRVSVIPIARGESVVLRLLNRADSAIELSALGFDAGLADALRRWCGLRHGLVIVTGPTGCGKTTTLNSILRAMNTEQRKIVTIEDPVEYILDGVDQIQTDERIGLTFGPLLRRVLRQDPDVIMVGEIRDEETAELAARAALTGHLVLTTLHTNNAVAAITRLQNMGLPRYLIAAVLRAVLAQRLLRRICLECCGAGCGACDGFGYRGRLAIGELLTVDDGIASLVQEGAPESTIRAAMAKAGGADLLTAGRSAQACGRAWQEDVSALEAG